MGHTYTQMSHEVLSAAEYFDYAVKAFNKSLSKDQSNLLNDLTVYDFQFRDNDNWLGEGEKPKLYIAKVGLMNWQCLDNNNTFESSTGTRREVVLALTVEQLSNVLGKAQALEMIKERAYIKEK